MFKNYSTSIYGSLIEPRLNESLKTECAKFKAEEIVKNRSIIKASIHESLIKAVVDKEEALVQIDDVVIDNVDLTDELEKAIENKQVMEQEAKKKEYEVLKEKQEAEIVVVKAKAQAESVILAGKAEADAIRMKSEALKESENIIMLEFAKRWNGSVPAYVSTGSGQGLNVLLPFANQK